MERNWAAEGRLLEVFTYLLGFPRLFPCPGLAEEFLRARGGR